MAAQKTGGLSAVLRRFPDPRPRTNWPAEVAPVRIGLALGGGFARWSIPVRHEGRLLVNGAMSMEIPALLAHRFGATHVISVHLPAQASHRPPANVFQVTNRCFQIIQGCNEQDWRKNSDLVVTPDVRAVDWDGFGCGPELLKAGEAAALSAVPKIQARLAGSAGILPASIPT